MNKVKDYHDSLELNDPKTRREIKKSNEDVRAGRTRPARELLAELRGEETSIMKRSRTKPA